MPREFPSADPSAIELLRATYVVQKAEAARWKTVARSLVAANEAAFGADDRRLNPLLRSPDFKVKLDSLIPEAKMIAALAIADMYEARRRLVAALGRPLTAEET